MTIKLVANQGHILAMPLYVDRNWRSASDNPANLAFLTGNKLANTRLFSADVVSIAKDGSSIVVHCAEMCDRCDGKKILKWALHVDAGLCFACEGEGVLWKNKRLYTRAKISKLNAASEAKRVREESARVAMRSKAIQQNAKLLPKKIMDEVLAWREKMLIDAGFYVEFDDNDQRARAEWWLWHEKHEELLRNDVIGDDHGGFQLKRNITLHDMACNLLKQELTQKAVDYLVTLWLAKQGEQARQDKAEAEKVEVPNGKQTITGVIKSVKVTDGYYGTERKMLVSCKGFNLWGSIPSKVLEFVDYDTEKLKGQQVTFSATIEAKERGFGFYKRPTKAALSLNT